MLEQETPFDGGDLIARNADGTVIPTVAHDLGLVEDFSPTTLTGETCSPAHHLYQRTLHRDGAGNLRWHPDAASQVVLDCPATVEGIKQRLRERGLEGIPAKARAWLTLMLPPEQSRGLGIDGGISVAVLKSMDGIRTRRDPNAGSKLVPLLREAQTRSDRDAQIRLQARLDRARKA